MLNNQWFLYFLAISSALLSLYILTYSLIPRWVRLYRINTKSISHILLPAAVAVGLYIFFPAIPPILANIVTILIPRKREELAKLDYVVQERDVSILGPEWVSLYQQVATSGKIPSFAINMARGAENTLMVVTTLALQRDNRLLRAMQAGIRAAEKELRSARSQAQSIIAFPYIALIFSTIAWIAVPLFVPVMKEANDVVNLFQVFAVVLSAAGTEIVHRAMS